MKTKTDKKQPATAPSSAPEILTLSTQTLAVWKGNMRETPQEGLDDLAASIRANGVLQPLLARPVADYYEVICGKRRLTAAIMAGLHVVPCAVRAMDDRAAAAAVAAENLDREDFAPLDAAQAVSAAVAAYGDAQAAADALARPLAWVRRVSQVAANLTGQWFSDAKTAGLSLTFLVELARLPDAAQDYLFTRFNEDWLEDGGDLHALRRMISSLTAEIGKCAWLAKDKGCAMCAKRSDAQPDLFDDEQTSHPVCLDITCREEKRAAHIAKAKVSAAAKAATTPDKIAEARWASSGDAKKQDAAHTVPVVISEGPASGSVVWRAPDREAATADATPRGPSPQQRLAARHIRAVSAAVDSGAVAAWAADQNIPSLLAAVLMFGCNGEYPGEKDRTDDFASVANAQGAWPGLRAYVAASILCGIRGRLRFDKVSDCEGAYGWSVFIASTFNIQIPASAKGSEQ